MRRFTNAQLADGCVQMAQSRRVWLETFSTGKNARPEWEIQRKQEHLAMLEEIEALLRAADMRKAS